MAFENSQALTVEGKNIICKDQFECTCRLEVPNEKPVKKVLSVNAAVKITGQEKIANGINFAGNTNYHIAYETEDGTFASVSAVASWQQSFENIQNENIAILPQVKENIITGQSSSEIAVSSLIDVDVIGIVNEKINSVDGMGSEYVKLEKTHEYQKAVNFVCDNFNEVAELQLNGKVEDVLGYFGNVRLKNVVAGIDTVTIEGEAFVNVNLLIDGEIQSQVKVIEFKHESAVLSTVPNNLIDANIHLARLNVSATVSEIDGKSTLIYALDFGTDITVYARDNMVVVEDLYSLYKETACEYQCVETSLYDGEKRYTDNQVVSFLTEEAVDMVCFVSNATVSISDITKSDAGATINGAICTDVVLKGENDTNFAYTGFAPFTFEIPEYLGDEQFDLTANILSFKLKTQNEISLTVELNLTAKNFKKDFINFVSSVQENEDKEQNSSAVRVYITGDRENIFNIAKTINVRPEDIMAQNPDAQNDLEKGTRLVIYTPLNLNF